MKKLKVFSLVMMLILSLGLLTSCSSDSASNDDKISVKLTLVDKDQQEYSYDIKVTPGSSLRSALFEAELIDEENFGSLFVETIDGHTADVENDGCTWMPKNAEGQQIMGNFDEITLKDGDVITLEYFVVPDMD